MAAMAAPASFSAMNMPAKSIVALGTAVEGRKLGEKVTAMPVVGCGHCEACIAEIPILCTSIEPVFGGFSEYLRAPARAVVPLPEMLSLADGALVEPLAVGLHGVRTAAMRPGARVLVLGAGTVYLPKAPPRSTGRGGSARGASLRLRDPTAARTWRSRWVRTPFDFKPAPDEVAEVQEALGGPPEIVFECAGAVRLLARGNHPRQTLRQGPVARLLLLSARSGSRRRSQPSSRSMISFPLVTYSQREFQYVAERDAARPCRPKDDDHDGRPDSPISTATFERLRTANADTKIHIAPF